MTAYPHPARRIWDELWRSHHQIKRLLTFSVKKEPERARQHADAG